MTLAEAALKWTLAYPEVSTSIPGIRNLRQALLNCPAGDGDRLSAPSVKKAEKLYLGNFGLPVKKIASDEGIHAVLMSGVKVQGPSPNRPATRVLKKSKSSKPRKKPAKAGKRKSVKKKRK